MTKYTSELKIIVWWKQPDNLSILHKSFFKQLKTGFSTHQPQLKYSGATSKTKEREKLKILEFLKIKRFDLEPTKFKETTKRLNSKENINNFYLLTSLAAGENKDMHFTKVQATTGIAATVIAETTGIAD